MSEATVEAKFWRDINHELWHDAVSGVPPRAFIRAELWRRVAHTRVLEKSASIRMARRSRPQSAIFRACSWLTQNGPVAAEPYGMPEGSALDPENAARPSVWPASYPGVDISQPVRHDTDRPSDNYTCFVHAFVLASQAARNVGLSPEAIDFQFGFTGDRWVVSGSETDPFKKISINFFYLLAPPKIWNAIFEAIVHNHHPSRKVAEQYAHSSDAQNLLEIYADMSPLRIYDVYDLSEMFDDLNEEFFNNAIPKPILAWTSKFQYVKLGDYDFHWDIIRLSKALNNRLVPEFVVRFVLYHEMLHIKHGARHDRRGRLRSHTPEFNKEEKRFPQYEEAEYMIAHLKDILNGRNIKPNTPLSPRS